jgi:hypothetical protein
MSDQNINTSDRIALAAAILAAAAFIIASLQALLEYSSSGVERDKCTTSAIDVSRKAVYRKWSFRAWKWRYYYPELDLSFHKVSRYLVVQREGSIEQSPVAPAVRSEMFYFRGLESNEAPSANVIQ